MGRGNNITHRHTERVWRPAYFYSPISCTDRQWRQHSASTPLTETPTFDIAVQTTDKLSLPQPSPSHTPSTSKNHPSFPEVIENPTTPQLSSALIHQNPIPDLRSWIWTNTAKNDARGTKCIVILSIHLYPYPKKDGKETHPTRKSMWDNLFRC